MSNAGLNEGSDSKRSDLRNIFDAMAYDDSGTGNLAFMKKWLEDQKNILSSYSNDVLVGDDSTGRTVRLEGLAKVIGSDVKARLLNKDSTVIEAYKRVYEKDAATVILNRDTQVERKSKLLDLLKSKAKDLVQLEAYAGNVPAWIIEKNDGPKWSQSVNSSVSEAIRTQLEAGNSDILVRLNVGSYCLKNIIAVLSAAVQVDGPVLVMISPNADSNVQQLLPVLYLIQYINCSGIRNRSIDVLLVTSDLMNSGLLKKLAAADESLKRNKTKNGVIEIGVRGADQPITNTATTAALNLSVSNGSTIHYIVDSSADISSAVSSISRNVWSDGIEMNHRCRSLAFVHQPVYTQVVQELKEIVEKMKVKSWDSNALANCDFVSQKIDGSSAALSSVNKLGAKLLAVKPDFSVPTVVYDIGTSSDLVAVKESGLGYILVLIPYRSANELFSLGNNFGIPDKVFLYANCISTSMAIIRKLNASEILVNSASPSSPHQHGLSWQVIPKSETSKKAANASVPSAKSEANSSKWRELSCTAKTQKLNQLIKATGVDNPILSVLQSHYLDALRGSALCLPSKADNAPSGIILAAPAEISMSILITPLIACILRDKPVVIVSIGSELPSQLVASVKDHLPAGLVSFVTVNSVKDMASLASSWELAWVLQGSGSTIELDIFPVSSENRVLLVNNPSDMDVAYNAKLAIASSLKNYYI